MTIFPSRLMSLIIDEITEHTCLTLVPNSPNLSYLSLKIKLYFLCFSFCR